MSTDKPKKVLRLMKFGKKKEDISSKLNQMWNSDQMPYSLQSCFAFVYYFNIDAVHILRKNGNKVAHEVLYSYLINNKEIAPTFYVSSVYDVCSALKAYVKDIPDGLLVKDLRHDWHKLVRFNNETKVREKLSSIILKLPSANRTMLFHLLFLASKISENRLKNEMSTKSVSIILMPTMFERVIDIRKVRDLYAFYDLLEFMIDNVMSLIGKEVYENIESNLKSIGKNLNIIDEIGDEPDKLDEDKRVQFVSQDSGLNSSSFIDDKSSQSQSNISRVNNMYEQSVLSDHNISSMEDLLNTSDAVSSDINDKNARRHIYRSTTIVHNASIAGEHVTPVRERYNSNQSTSSLSSIEDDATTSQCDQYCGQRWNHKTKPVGHTCMGYKPHNISECRPYSICGPPNISDMIPNCSHSHTYLPVYDRTFQHVEDSGPSRTLITKPAIVSCARTIKKKKPVLKRSSCVIVVPVATDKNTIVTSSCSMNSDHRPAITYDPKTFFESTKVPQIVSKQKSRIKKKSFLFRSRLSVPLIISGEAVVQSDQPQPQSPIVCRTVSLQQSDLHLNSHYYHHRRQQQQQPQQQSQPLPQPLATFLRQRSADETFV